MVRNALGRGDALRYIRSLSVYEDRGGVGPRTLALCGGLDPIPLRTSPLKGEESFFGAL